MEARKRWGWKVKAASFEAGTEAPTRLLSNKVSLDSENKQPENTECSVGRKVLLWAKPATKATTCLLAPLFLSVVLMILICSGHPGFGRDTRVQEW